MNNRYLNHVTLNGFTLRYNSTSVYIGSTLVYEGTVNLEVLTKLSIVLKGKILL